MENGLIKTAILLVSMEQQKKRKTLGEYALQLVKQAKHLRYIRSNSAKHLNSHPAAKGNW